MGFYLHAGITGAGSLIRVLAHECAHRLAFVADTDRDTGWMDDGLRRRLEDWPCFHLKSSGTIRASANRSAVSDCGSSIERCVSCPVCLALHPIGMTTWSNKAGAGNGASALSFHVERLRRAVPDLVRWAILTMRISLFILAAIATFGSSPSAAADFDTDLRGRLQSYVGSESLTAINC